MPRRALLALTALLLAGTALPGHAAGEPLALRLCQFSSLTDPGYADRQVGELDGGPVAARAVDPAAGTVLVTLTCTLRTGPYDATYLDPAAASASASGIGVAVLEPTPVAYPLAPDAFVSVCTEVTIADGAGSTHWYWDTAHQEFSTDQSVSCAPPACLDSSCGPDPVQGLLDLVTELSERYVDPVLCPVLASVFPPEGDIEIWDCPPYGTR